MPEVYFSTDKCIRDLSGECLLWGLSSTLSDNKPYVDCFLGDFLNFRKSGLKEIFSQLPLLILYYIIIFLTININISIMIHGCHKSGKPGKLGKMSIFDQKQGKPGKVRAKVWKSGQSQGIFLKMVFRLLVFW